MICVDASVAAKWVLTEEYSAEARALLKATLEAKEPVVAPAFLPVELTNILRQRMRRQPEVSLEAARQMLSEFLTYPIVLASPAGLYDLALTLADRYRLPAVYDAHYLALAQILGCDLWTDDRRLLNAVQGSIALVKWVGNYTEGAAR